MKKNLIEEIDRMRSLISAKHGIIKPFLFEVLKEQNNVEQLGRGTEGDNPDVLYDENYYSPLPQVKTNYKKKNTNFYAQLNELNVSFKVCAFDK